MYLLDIRDLSKHFGGIRAVEEVSLKVREVAQQVGMVIRIMLMILVFYNEITRLFFSS